MRLNKVNEALACFKTIYELNPNNAPVYNVVGVELSTHELLEEALKCFDEAARIDPTNVEYHYNRGIILQRQQQAGLACEAYKKALVITPDYEFLFGRYLNMKLHLCDWREFKHEIESYTSQIEQRNPVTTPFVASILLNRPDLHKTVAQQYSKVITLSNQLVNACHPKKSELLTIRLIFTTMPRHTLWHSYSSYMINLALRSMRFHSDLTKTMRCVNG